MSRRNALFALLIGIAVSARGTAGSAGALFPGACKPVAVCQQVQPLPAPVPVCQPVKAVPACGPVQACAPVRAHVSHVAVRKHRSLRRVKTWSPAHYRQHSCVSYETAPVGTKPLKVSEQPTPAPAPPVPTAP